ncbi:MAG: hypothetical protein OQL28_15040 [Sedimenticola sp.]|nr:hypothetical protein [Sedimenticola sp.]
MLKVLMIPLTLLLSSSVHAGCQMDPPELGDIGPDSGLVCEMLEHQHPYSAQIRVLDRALYSRNRVRVMVALDNHPASLLYDLVGANWRLTGFRFGAHAEKDIAK